MKSCVLEILCSMLAPFFFPLSFSGHRVSSFTTQPRLASSVRASQHSPQGKCPLLFAFVDQIVLYFVVVLYCIFLLLLFCFLRDKISLVIRSIFAVVINFDRQLGWIKKCLGH